MRITQKRNKTPLIATLITVAVLIVAAGGYFTYAYMTKSIWPFYETTQTSSDGINYSAPTEQEEEASQDAKKNNTQQTNTDSNTSGDTTTKRAVSVGIAFAAYDVDEKAVDVRAFTPDVIEGDGTCTATFTLDGRTVTATSKAFVDSSSSQCEPILVPESKFEVKGVWKLSVSYSSSKSTGVSPTMDVKVSK